MVAPVFDIINQMHWLSILLAMLAVFAGAFIKGTAGFGFGMVAAPVMMIIDPVFVPGPLLVLAMMASMLIVFKEWRNIDVKGLSFALSGRLTGTLLAVVMVSFIPLALYGIVFGILVLGAILLSVNGWRFVSSNRNLITAGVASGFMGTLTSIGAPPIAMVYQHEKVAVIRSTLAAFFLFGTAISIAALYLSGRFTLEQFIISILFIPPLLGGLRLSTFIVAKLNMRIVRFAILSLSGISSIILIIRSAIALINVV